MAEVLAGGAYGDAVRADEREARELGAGGFLFFVFDRRYGVSGAQPSDVLLEVMQRAWDERSPAQVLAGGTDAGSAGVCGPDGCELP